MLLYCQGLPVWEPWRLRQEHLAQDWVTNWIVCVTKLSHSLRSFYICGVGKLVPLLPWCTCSSSSLDSSDAFMKKHSFCGKIRPSYHSSVEEDVRGVRQGFLLKTDASVKQHGEEPSGRNWKWSKVTVTGMGGKFWKKVALKFGNFLFFQMKCSCGVHFLLKKVSKFKWV